MFVHFLVAIICFYAISITDYGGIYVGMSNYEAYNIFSSNSSFVCYGDYSFFENKWGNAVIVRTLYNADKETHTVTDIRCYSSLWTNTSPNTFRQIEKGMSIYEVTSLIGLPYDSKTSGLPSFEYYDTEGNSYCTYFAYPRPGKDNEPWTVNGILLTRKGSDVSEQILT